MQNLKNGEISGFVGKAKMVREALDNESSVLRTALVEVSPPRFRHMLSGTTIVYDLLAAGKTTWLTNPQKHGLDDWRELKDLCKNLQQAWKGVVTVTYRRDKRDNRFMRIYLKATV